MRNVISRLLTVLTIAMMSVGLSEGAWAGAILIIHGAGGTSEPVTTSDITANLNSLHIAAGNTTTLSDGVPGDLSGFDQIWDIRFSNNLAISAAQQAQYFVFIQGGGGMFVMGENAGFSTRNDSVLALIDVAGGGSLVFTTPISTQTVLAPFTGPNPIPDGDVTYAAPGGVTSAGSGQFITQDGSGNGTGIAFGVGDLSNAVDGALTAIFDVNFMQANFDQPDSQNLLKNLIQFVGDEVDPPNGVPEPGTLAAFAIGLAGLCLARRRRVG